MAPPRRVRDEALILRKPGKPDSELFRAQESLYEREFPTQRRFQVSPDARVLAYKAPAERQLHLIRHDGKSLEFFNAHDEYRFSPDGTRFAVATWLSAFQVEQFSARTWRSGPFSRNLPYLAWMEYCAEGLVMLQYAAWDSERELVLASADGSVRSIAQVAKGVRRFVTAKEGSRVVYFVDGQVWSISAPGARPEHWAQLNGPVTNAEMSPDGQSLVVLTEKQAYLLVQGDELPKPLGIPNAHTVWFSRDGSQFVVANATMARWQRGEKMATLSASEEMPIRSARFAPSSPWIMVARGHEAVRWNPDFDESEVIATLDDERDMLGVDVFRGGLVLWSGSKWERYGWGGKRLD